MSEIVVERTTEISSQNRVYTENPDREHIPVAQDQTVFVEITESGEGAKEFDDLVVQLHEDGEFFIPSATMNELGLSVGDEITYRIY